MGDITLGDLQAVRNVLDGGSVIDWQRLDFRDHDEVDRFLRVNEFSPQNREDLLRLEELRAEAVDYLRANFSFQIPASIADTTSVRDLFLLASAAGAGARVYACVILKVMHIIHHLAGRELLFRLPISDDQMFTMGGTKGRAHRGKSCARWVTRSSSSSGAARPATRSSPSSWPSVRCWPPACTTSCDSA